MSLTSFGSPPSLYFSVSESFISNVLVSLFLDPLYLSITVYFSLDARDSFHPFDYVSAVSLSLSLCLSLSASVSASVSMCVSVSLSASLVSVCVSLDVSAPFLSLPSCTPRPTSGRTASLLRPPARGQHRPGPRAPLSLPGWARVPPPTTCPSPWPCPISLSSQPPRVFVSLALTLPLCLSLAAPAPPQPHLPLRIPWAAWGGWWGRAGGPGVGLRAGSRRPREGMPLSALIPPFQFL